jgi:hypothetical protein
MLSATAEVYFLVMVRGPGSRTVSQKMAICSTTV